MLELLAFILFLGFMGGIWRMLLDDGCTTTLLGNWGRELDIGYGDASPLLLNGTEGGNGEADGDGVIDGANDNWLDELAIWEGEGPYELEG